MPEKDSTKLSGLDVNVDLIGEIKEQDGRTGGDEKGMEESDDPTVRQFLELDKLIVPGMDEPPGPAIHA